MSSPSEELRRTEYPSPRSERFAHLFPVRMIAQLLFAAVGKDVSLRVHKGHAEPGELTGKSVRPRLIEGKIPLVEEIHVNFQLVLRRGDEIVVKDLRGQKGVNEQDHRHDELGNPEYFLSHADLPVCAEKRIAATLPYPFLLFL